MTPHTLAFQSRQLGYGLEGLLSSLWAWLALCLAAFAAIFSVLKGLRNFRIRSIRWSWHAQVRLQVDSLSPSAGRKCSVTARSVFSATLHESASPEMDGVGHIYWREARQHQVVGRSRKHPPATNRFHINNLAPRNPVLLAEKAGCLPSVQMAEAIPEIDHVSNCTDLGHSKDGFLNASQRHQTLPEIDDIFHQSIAFEAMPYAASSLEKSNKAPRDSCQDGTKHVIFHEVNSFGIAFSIPNWACSLLPPRQSFRSNHAAARGLSLQTHVASWDAILKMRVKTAIEREFLKPAQKRFEEHSPIVLRGSPHLLVAKGDVVKLWNTVGGGPIQSYQFGDGFVTALDANWALGLASLARSNGTFLIWDLNRAKCINSYAAQDSFINSLVMDAGVLTLTGGPLKEKRAFSTSLWDSRVWSRPVGTSTALQGILQEMQFRGHYLYVRNTQNSIFFHDLRMLGASPARLRATDDEKGAESWSLGMMRAEVTSNSVHTDDECFSESQAFRKANETAQILSSDENALWGADEVLVSSDSDDICDDCCQGLSAVGGERGKGEGGRSLLSRCVSAVMSFSSALTT